MDVPWFIHEYFRINIGATVIRQFLHSSRTISMAFSWPSYDTFMDALRVHVLHRAQASTVLSSWLGSFDFHVITVNENS